MLKRSAENETQNIKRHISDYRLLELSRSSMGGGSTGF